MTGINRNINIQSWTKCGDPITREHRRYISVLPELNSSAMGSTVRAVLKYCCTKCEEWFKIMKEQNLF